MEKGKRKQKETENKDQDDSERGRDYHGFMMIEKEESDSRERADDEEDKVEGKNTLSWIFYDTFVIRKNIYIYLF